jgi:O-6-methylguanine DNA methyltransferase
MPEKADIQRKINCRLDLTVFQKKVYKVILEIPEGRTRSYKWVAWKIGNPQAFRAVGNALKKNPFAPEVPCHRVICSDGSIGGYAGGVRKKKAILRQEGVKIPWN